MTRSPADEFRKVQFRELARDILKTDRERRKYGMAQDTGGAIARALEQAYQRGRKEERDGLPDIPPQDGELLMNWHLIPPCPRNAFWCICLNTLGGSLPFSHKYACIELVQVRHTSRVCWALLEGDGDISSYNKNKTWGQKTIQPLIRLGLLIEQAQHQFVLSEKGILTWREALSRVNYDVMQLVG